jgi:beta-N-acetylhexosaminidase
MIFSSFLSIKSSNFEPSLGQRAGRCMMVRIIGTSLDQDTAEFLRQHQIGGVCLFRNNMRDAAQLRALIADLRALLGAEALIALDQEGGAVTRTTWLPVAPSAMSLGASHDPALCYEVGAAVARGIKALGFNWNFAPVVDVNSNPHNPIIAERSFGMQAEQVSTLAAAWMQGSLAEGVACCLKHFPGHGDTHYDSHRALPTVDKTRAELEQVEFLPFRHCAKDAPAIMTAHIVYSALDADLPATLSPKILRGVLREEMGFDGVIVTDDMAMQAIANQYGAGNAAVLALQAGADLVLALGSRETQLETWQAIGNALASGVITQTENDASLRRLQQLAHTYPSRQSADQYSEAADAALMASAWQRGISAYGEVRLPTPGAPLRLVMRADAMGDGVSDAGVTVEQMRQVLARYFPLEIVTFEDAAQFDWSSLPSDGRYTILASTTRARYASQRCASWTPDLHLVLWGPYLAFDINAPALISYGFATPALEAMVACLRAALLPSGTLQINSTL